MPEAEARASGAAPELYVYYRVAEVNEAALRAAVLRLQADLCASHPGLHTRLLRRPELLQGEITFMETYLATAPGGVDARLQAAIAAAAHVLAPWLKGARHTEVFTPCA